MYATPGRVYTVLDSPLGKLVLRGTETEHATVTLTSLVGCV
jgi:hypothetical protein